MQRTKDQIDTLKIIMGHEGIASRPVSSLAANSTLAAAKLTVSMKPRGINVSFEMDMDVKTSWHLKVLPTGSNIWWQSAGYFSKMCGL